MLIIPEMCMGGAQRSIAKLSLELASYATIFLVVFNNEYPVAYSFAGELISLDVVPGKSWLSKGYAFWKRVKKLQQLKTKLNIDVCISFLEGADYVNVFSRQKEKIILSIRGSKIHDEIMLNHFFWLRNNILIPWIYKKADLIVAVNRGIANELKTHHGIAQDRIEIIGNFYDFNEIITLSKEPKDLLGLTYQNSVLVITGRLSPEKGIKGLIKVFIKLKRIKSDICLVIVGDGPELDHLILLCEEANLRISQGQIRKTDVDVIFTGNQKNVFKYLKSASLYLMNSSSEGFPNGMVEAMICGLPVMSADCPYGPREILSPDLDGDLPVADPHISPYGILMPFADTEDSLEIWAKTISNVLSNRDLLDQIIKDGRSRVQSFDKKTIVSQWLKILA